MDRETIEILLRVLGILVNATLLVVLIMIVRSKKNGGGHG